MDNSIFVISRNTVSNQKIGLLISIAIVTFFILFILIDLNFYYLLIAFLGAGFLLPFNLFGSRFYDIRIEDDVFVLQNLYKQTIELQSDLFDKITIMDTIHWRPSSPYFTIYFKNGQQFNFTKKMFGDIKYAFQDKKVLAKQQTEEIERYLKEIKEGKQ